MGRAEFESRLQSYVDQIRQYDDPERQQLARALLPLDQIEENAAVALAKEGKFEPSKEEMDHYILLQLLVWFKSSFRWMNSPDCDFCGSKTEQIGMGPPSPEDLHFGANRVELYVCSLCGTITRFPRYNDPAKLMETQCGRCGEWANCFTCYCVALGYETRLVLDFTDHLWTECYSPYLKRWMHLDPCEASYDKPLLYESGWNKQLSYIISFGKDGVHDVTKRYTRKWTEVLSRRKLVSEDEAEEIIGVLTAMQRSRLEPEELDALAERDNLELEEISRAETSPVADENLPGRKSGSEEWRRARGELGAQDAHLHRSFHPARVCIDEHVGRVYKAIGLLASGDQNELEVLQGILLRFKEQPFKSRKLELGAEEARLLRSKALASFLEAIGLVVLEKEGGKVELSMKETPVKVSLALPVALENLEKITQKGHDQSSLELMSEAHRICGGTACATGEETPTGIASAAFDGLYSTKWEEPEGAKGACLVYELHQTLPVVGYDLVSANDCSERDPMDWVLEGTEDGEKWQLIDKRAGELFQERFQRRCFRVEENIIPCKLIRFRFTSVRDAAQTTRLQLACIDLYQPPR